MTERLGDALMLACVADQSASAAALHEALRSLFPRATIARLDPDAERVMPGAVNCAIIDSAVNGVDGIDVLRRLRAGGYAGAAVLFIDGERVNAPGDESAAARLGARFCALDGALVTPLAEAVAEALRMHDGAEEDGPLAHAVRALRHTQRLIAAGEVAMRLQHSLNNPLAALLAEAQLLEMETLDPEHRAAVERIIELCRRVVLVVRGLDGVGRA